MPAYYAAVLPLLGALLLLGGGFCLYLVVSCIRDRRRGRGL